NEGKLPPQLHFIYLPGASVAPAHHHDHRRSAALRLDELEPILRVTLRQPAARLQHERVQTALGEEELVRGMENLLPAEIPRSRPHLAARTCERQVADSDGMCLRLMRARLFAGEALYQRGLPRSPAADEEELQLKQRATLLVA